MQAGSRTSNCFAGASATIRRSTARSISSRLTAAMCADEPIETRKAELARLLTGCHPLALVLNRVYDEPGPVVFEHACLRRREGGVPGGMERGARGFGAAH